MANYECRIVINIPGDDLTLHYTTLAEAIEAVAPALALGGFNETGMGNHKISIYVYDQGDYVIKQIYYSRHIDEQQIFHLRKHAAQES